MLKELLKDYRIILASGSPRRQQFFVDLGLHFTIETKTVEEIFPNELIAAEITEYLAKLKAAAFAPLPENAILITSDTIVWKGGKAIGKPNTFEEAAEMLRHLSGEMHEVITSVSFTGKDFQKTISCATKVWFKKLNETEIEHYLKTYKPFDKAGAYGIQEWLGHIAIEKIEGSYNNVMGLPTHLVYQSLLEIAADGL